MTISKGPWLAFALSAAGAAALASCATAEAGDGRAAAGATQGERQCFRASQVRNYSAVDRDTVDVEISRNDVYRLELLGFCDDINWSTRIALRSRTGSFICAGHDAEIVVPSQTGPQRCTVTSIRRLSEAEIAARRGG